MAKVDRLGWTAGMSIEAYGVTVGVRTNDAAILPLLPERCPPGWQASEREIVDLLFSLRVGAPAAAGRRHYHLLYVDAGRAARSFDLEAVLDQLEASMQLLVAYAARDDLLFVHAGVVGWQGCGIVIPGRTNTGKTSLVAALLQAGAAFYSDEYAILDSEGRVHPYPKPLAVRGEGSQCRTPPAVFGAQVGREPLPVRLIVATSYAAGARWRPRRLSPGRALLTLLDNTVAARRRPQASLPILEKAVLGATTIQSQRDEAEAVAPRLLSYLDRMNPQEPRTER